MESFIFERSLFCCYYYYCWCYYCIYYSIVDFLLIGEADLDLISSLKSSAYDFLLYSEL